MLLIYVTQIAGGELGAAAHFIFRLLLLIFFLNILLLLSKSTLDNCEIVKVETVTKYKYGNNFTGYHWDYDNNPPPAQNNVFIFHTNTTNTFKEICYTQNKNTALTFYNIVLWLNRLFWLYVIIYLSYYVFRKGFSKYWGEGN